MITFIFTIYVLEPVTHTIRDRRPISSRNSLQLQQSSDLSLVSPSRTLKKRRREFYTSMLPFFRQITTIFILQSVMGVILTCKNLDFIFASRFTNLSDLPELTMLKRLLVTATVRQRWVVFRDVALTVNKLL